MNNLTKWRLSVKMKLSKKNINMSYFFEVRDFYKNKEIEYDLFKEYKQIFEIWDINDYEVLGLIDLLNVDMEKDKKIELMIYNVSKEKLVSKDTFNYSYFYKHKDIGQIHIEVLSEVIKAFVNEDIRQDTYRIEDIIDIIGKGRIHTPLVYERKIYLTNDIC